VISMRKRVEAFYSGKVQGVGFRFTAESFAIKMGINGWVKNLSDGRVQLVAEGQEAAIKEFLEKIKQEFSRYLKDSAIQWQDASGEFNSFQVRF